MSIRPPAATGTSAAVADTERSIRDRAYRTWDALLSDPAVSAPRVHFSGHSIVNGTGASGATTKFTAVAAKKLSAIRSGVLSTDDGHGSGYTSTQLLANGVSANFTALAAGSVGLLVIMCAANDPNAGIASATTRTNLASLIAAYRANAAAAPNMSVLLLAESERSDLSGSEPWSAYVAALQAIAVADPNTAVLDLNARLGAVSGNTVSIFGDAVHPNTRGHAMIADLVVAEVTRGQMLTQLAPYPTHVTLLAALAPVAQSGWAGVTRDTDNQILRYSDGNQNNSITYQFVGEAGTYTISLDRRQQTNGGKFDIYIDGALQGAGATWEGYAAANADAFNETTGFAIATSGVHTLQLKMATKHASSSGYAGVIRGIYVTRTGS